MFLDFPPRKLSSERQPLSLFYQPETLGVKCLVGGVAETGAHIALPGYCLLWPYTCWLLLLKGRKENWFLATKIDSEWTDMWRIARVYKASPSFGCWQMFLVLTEYSRICVHLRSCTEGNGSHQRKVLFRILFCFVLFFEGRVLEAYLLECVWMVMVQLRCLYPGLGWHIRSIWRSLK